MNMLGRIPLRIHFLSSASFRGRGGEAVHGLVINEISKVNMKLAERVHSTEGVKPFSVSPVFVKEGRSYLERGDLYVEKDSKAELILFALNQEVLEAFISVFTSSIEEGRRLRLGNGEVMIESIGVKRMEMGGFSTFEEILKSAVVARRCEFNIITPLTFRQKGLNQPFPLPELMFSSLLRIWNTFSDIKIPVSLCDRFKEIAVGRFNLKTEMWCFSGYSVIGCKGEVVFILDKGFKEEELKFISALSILANFSGIGYKRSMGMGIVEARVKEDKE